MRINPSRIACEIWNAIKTAHAPPNKPSMTSGESGQTKNVISGSAKRKTSASGNARKWTNAFAADSRERIQ